jgi:pimeloyl-ACP methyl ester carboxylesterase
MRLRSARLACIAFAATAVLAAIIPLYLIRINMTPHRLDGAHPSPADFKIPHETIDVIASDGVAIRAWLLIADTGAPVVIVVHGKGASKSGLLNMGRVLHRAGFHVLLPDLRGHGESGEALLTFGLMESLDIEAALGALKRRPYLDATRIGLYAHSMGTAAALMGAGRDPGARAAVFDSGYDALEPLIVDIGSNVYGLPRWLAQGGVAAFRLLTGHAASEVNPAAILRERPLPCLFFHSAADGTIPFARGRALYNAASGPKEWIETNGAHTGAWGEDPEGYEQRVVAFFEKHL